MVAWYAAPMTSRNAAAARRWFDEVWNERRLDVIDELMAQGCVGHHPDRVTRSAGQFKVMYAQMLATFPDVRVTVESVADDGDDVAVRWRFRATHTGAGLGVPPTGLPIDVVGTTWMRFADGRIVEGWDIWDRGALMAGLSRA